MIELMVVIALVGMLVALVAPSMRGLISTQRVRGTNAELVTDLQYVRSEAARRNRDVRVGFQASDTLSCYVAYVEPEAWRPRALLRQASMAAPAVAIAVSRRATTCARRPGARKSRRSRCCARPGSRFSATSAAGPIINFGRRSRERRSRSRGASAPGARSRFR